MPTRGDFSRVFVNGNEITNDVEQETYSHMYRMNKVQSQNVGIEQYAPGLFDPTASLQGFTRRGIGAVTAQNILQPSGIGSQNDLEFIITSLLGNQAAPTQGDCAWLIDSTLMDFKPIRTYTDQQRYNASFKARGLRMPPHPVLLYFNEALKTATNISSTPYDDGAESNAGTLQGGVGVLQIYAPTGVAATGNISLSGQPSDGDTFTINGTVYTFKTALTPTAGQVLIGASVGVTIQNLWAAITGGLGSGTTYAAGTTSFTQNLLFATVFFAVPNASNQILITYATTGTAGNAFTLVKSGLNLAVSGATLAGGTAGDTYNVTLASSTSSGGSYTTHITWSGVGATRTALRTEIAIGTLINRWLKVTFTLASGAGTAQTLAANVVFGRYFQG